MSIKEFFSPLGQIHPISNGLGIKDGGDKEKNLYLLIYSFVFTFILGFIAHGYAFCHLLLSHDSLYEFEVAQNYEWKIQIGRFLNPAIRYVLGETIILPWQTGLFSLLMISLAVYFAAKTFGTQSKFKILALAGIFCVNKTIISLISTFMEDLSSDTTALMLSCLCAYLWSKTWKQKFNIKSLLTISGVIFLSLGIYQAYLSLIISMMIIVCIMHLFDDETVKDVFKHGLFGVLCVLLAGIVYYILWQVLARILGISLNVDDYNSLSNMWTVTGDAGLIEVIKDYVIRIVMCYVSVIKFLFYPARVTFFILIANAIIIMLCAYGFIVRIKTISKGSIAMALALLIVLPIAMNITQILGNISHDLTVFSVWLIYYLPFLLFGNCKVDYKKIKAVFSGTLAFIILALIPQANVVYVEKEITYTATQHIVNRVISDIEENEDYHFNETKVALVGSPGENDLTETIAAFRYLGGINCAITDPKLYRNTFKYSMKYPIILCTPDEMRKLEYNETVKTMPSYPEKGYIKLVDGILVVKW